MNEPVGLLVNCNVCEALVPLTKKFGPAFAFVDVAVAILAMGVKPPLFGSEMLPLTIVLPTPALMMVPLMMLRTVVAPPAIPSTSLLNATLIELPPRWVLSITRAFTLFRKLKTPAAVDNLTLALRAPALRSSYAA